MVGLFLFPALETPSCLFSSERGTFLSTAGTIPSFSGSRDWALQGNPGSAIADLSREGVLSRTSTAAHSEGHVVDVLGSLHV